MEVYFLKLGEENIIQASLKEEWMCLSVPNLWCLSVPNLVQNFLVNDQFISVTCRLEDKSFSFAGVYGATTYLSRRFLWSDLSFFTGPWCILRDFNVVLSADDYKGRLALNQVSCNEFLDLINTNDLSCITTKNFVNCGGFNMAVIKNRHNYPYNMTSS